MKYRVIMRVTGNYYIEVEASNKDEAEDIADERMDKQHHFILPITVQADEWTVIDTCETDI